MKGFTLVSGDRKQELLRVNCVERNLIFKAMDDCGMLGYLEDVGIVWSDPNPESITCEVKTEVFLTALKATYYWLKIRKKDWKLPEDMRKKLNLQEENNRKIAMKAIWKIIKILKDYKAETIIIRDDLTR